MACLLDNDMKGLRDRFCVALCNWCNSRVNLVYYCLCNCACDGVHLGLFMHPTVFTDVTDDMFIADEESFGPIMVISRFRKGSVSKC